MSWKDYKAYRENVKNGKTKKSYSEVVEEKKKKQEEERTIKEKKQEASNFIKSPSSGGGGFRGTNTTIQPKINNTWSQIQNIANNNSILAKNNTENNTLKTQEDRIKQYRQEIIEKAKKKEEKSKKYKERQENIKKQEEYDKLHNRNQDKKTLFKGTDVYNDNLRRFDNGYQFGDIYNTLDEYVGDTVKVGASTVADIGLNVGKGIVGVGENLGNALTGVEAQVFDWAGNKQYAERLRRNIASDPNPLSKAIDKVDKKLDKHTVIGEKGDEVVQNIGYMGALMAGETVGGPLLTNAMTFGSSLGSGLAEGYATEGATNGQVWASAIGGAGIETFTENLFGMFGHVDDGVTNAIAKKIKSGLGKQIARIGMQGVGEGTEEFISYALNYLKDRVIDEASNGKGAKFTKDFNVDEMLDQAGTAFLTSAIMGGGSTALQTSNIKNTYNVDTKGALDILGKMQDENANQQTQNNEVNNIKQDTDNQVIKQEIKTAQNQTSQAQNDAKTQTTNNLAKVRQFYDEDTYNQMKNFIETAPSEEALNQINEDIKTETKNRLEETYKSERFTESQDRKRTYAQYQRQNNTTGIQYDNSVVDNALDAVAPNRNGRRTVGQWKQVAEQIGLNATDLTKSQIDDIAYGSWFDLQPTKNITRYDNRTKEHKGFEKFTSDDWINTIYESAKGQKLQKLDTVLNQNIANNQEMLYNNITLGEVKNIPTEEVMKFKDDRNGGHRTQEQYEKLKQDIEENGIKNPIELVRNNDGSIEIENGNHRLQVANELGIKEVPVKFVESWDNIGIDEDSSESKIIERMEAYNDRNNKDSGETNLSDGRSRIVEGDRIDNRNESENRETATRDVEIYRGKQEDNNKSSGDTTFKENTKELEESSSFKLQQNKNINNKVEDYLNKTGLSSKMTVDEFISKAEQFTLENESNMTEQQKELYNIIKEIQDRNTVKEENVEYSGNEKIKDLKEKQNEIIQKSNPRDKTLGNHTWINSVEDIKTYQEAIEEYGEVDNLTPDFTAEDVKKALDTGEVTVYSSYPIEQGTFVTPSKMEAQSYAGKSEVYSKEVNLLDVAWIDEIQGQYAKVETQNNDVMADSQGRILSKQQQERYKDVSNELKDKDGNLKVLYTGSNSEFTIFNRDKGGQSNKSARVGFWFTETSEGARKFADSIWYGDNKPTVYEVYLNLKNPKIYDTVDTTSEVNQVRDEIKNKKKEQRKINEKYEYSKMPLERVLPMTNYGYSVEQILEDTGYSQEKINTYKEDIAEYRQLREDIHKLEKQLENMGYDDSYEQFRTDIYKIAGKTANDANTGGLGMMLENEKEIVEKYRQKLIDEGYDGIVIKNTRFDSDTLGGKNNQYVAFYSNQIKNVDNLTPTDNPDILKEEYQQLSIEGFNNEPENNLSKENWSKYQESKKKTNEVLKKEGTKVEVEKRKFSKDFIDNGYIDLNGKTIKNASEVADMAQIFRNPKYETFRVIYMKGNTIVGQEAVSSKTPNQTKVFTKNDSQARGLYKIQNRMERLGADGYYLIHNHPTGVARASDADINVTKVMDKKIKGFLGHIIINSGTYALIEKSKVPSFSNSLVWKDEIKIENYKPDKIDKMLSKEAWANVQLKSREDILNLAYDLKNNPNYSSLILTDTKQKPRIILDIPNNFLNMKLEQINGYIRNVAKQNGANHAYLATQDASVYEKMDFSNTLQDCILYSIDENGGMTAKQSKTKEAPGKSIFENYTSMALRANEKIEDIYNSFFNTEEKQETKLPMKEKQEVKAPIKQENTKVKFDNEVMKTNSEIKGNSDTSEKVAKILSEPTKNVKPEQRTWAILKANFIDKGAVFEKISQKTNNRDLQGKYDYTLTAGARGQYAIGNDRYVYSNGKKTLQSKSLTSIMDEVGENTQAFSEYMYHQLNVDRMTLEERANKQMKDIIEKYIVDYNDSQNLQEEIDKWARKKITKKTDKTDAEIITNMKKLKQLETVHNKPVFGETVTANDSRTEIAKLEEQFPQFKEYAKDVYKYLEANKQELVDKGVISQEISDLFKEMYPHYVPIQRANKNGNSISVPLDTGRTGINTPIKKAKGGNSDINPLFQTIASQTLQTYRASARNNFGVELMDTLGRMNQLNNTTTIADVDTIMDNMTNEEQNNELLTPGKIGQNPTFTVFVNGEKTTFDISQDMYDALKPKSELFNKLDNTKLAKTGRKISNFRRGVLTEYNPIFSITNAIKDAQDVLINSQHSAKTYAKFPEAYAQIVKKGYWYNEYIQNGGEQNSYFTEGDFENIKSSKLDKAKNVLKFPLEKISQVNNVIEMAPRLAEYIVSRQNGANIETAMLDASRVTTNFKAGGDITKFANRNGATFLNASVQGFQQQVRNIQEANMKGLKGWTNLALKYTVAGLPALLLNNLFWDDDDDYEQLQDYVKDNYYVIAKLPNGNFLRIPKGRMVATIQKVVSNANDFVKDGKINSDDVASTIWNDLKEDVSFGMDNLAPNNPVDNNILSPIIQVAQNKTWYGDDLVPQRLQDVPDAEQADESTDKLSRWLGEKLNVSPIKVNYLLDQYSGGIGDVLLPMGTPQAENNVIEDKFTTDPVMKSQYPSDFFSKVDELNVKHNSIKATDEDILKYKYISSVQQEVSSLYKQKREIQASDKSDATKKQELKEVQKQINELAKESLENVDNVKISGESATIGDKQYYKNKGTWTKLTDKEKEKLNGTSTSVYSDYKNATNGLSDKEKIQTLRDSNYSKSDKSNLYEKTISTDKYYSTLKKSGIDIDEYMDYKLAQSNGDFTADKKNGKTVMGSGKKKVLNYLNKNITGYGNRLLIAGKQYSLTDSQRKDLSNYINKTFATQAERTEVYKQLKLNFVVNGNKVTYK